MILKVAARNKKYNISEDDATMFTDPVTGATVRGDMMGINIKAIPTESQGKVCCSSAEHLSHKGQGVLVLLQ